MSDIKPQEELEQEEKTTTGAEMSLVDHLQELRRRLITCIVAILITSSGCYFYAAELIHLITAPAGKLYYMNPAEAFFAYLKVSVFAGFLLALPLVLYQTWAFVVPALTRQERKTSIFLVPASVILFFVGLAFSYVLVLPAGIKFFMGFATDELQPLFSLGEYLSFVISFLLPFGFVFELPLVILVGAKLGLVSSKFLAGKRKVMLVLSFVVGAVIAPSPDVVSQTMVAVPLLILYESSLLIVKYVLRK
ncbi:MAG: twin-arginine translocase subunit TatC [Negativicutes bacterium]|nr:twin-arginine translocase subunit TatC [Negativicutes bacterium]MDR3591026.1 twin-arginine translocase subunit TatC [Negativicutes bacterium]